MFEGLVGGALLALRLDVLSPTGLRTRARDCALAPSHGRVVDRRTFITPVANIVPLLLLVPADEDACLVQVLVVLGYEGGGVGIVDDVLPEVLLVLYDVVYEPAQERYVRPGPDRGVEVAHSRGTREARIDVDELSALLPGDHGVPEAHRVGLGHVGALYYYAVGILQIL